MSVTFIRPNGSAADVGFCDRNLNLLAHAQAIELDLGSECGGHGVCGKDRVRVRDHALPRLSPVTDEERRHLTAEELQAGWRLACQCFPETSGAQVELTLPAIPNR